MNYISVVDQHFGFICIYPVFPSRLLSDRLFQANYLFHALISAELPGVDYVDEVLKELEKEIEKARKAACKTRKQSKVIEIFVCFILVSHVCYRTF